MGTTTSTTTTMTMPSTTEKPSLPYAMLGRLRDVLANEGKRQGFSKIQVRIKLLIQYSFQPPNNLH